MMRFITRIVLLSLFISTQAHAKTEYTIGTTPYYPPFIMQGANGSLHGFDIAFMHKVCAKLNKTCNFKAYSFQALDKALLQGKVDFAIAAITITPIRAQHVHFTKPYMTSSAQFIGLSSLNVGQKSIDEIIKSVKVGVETGTVYVELLKQQGINQSDIRQYKSTSHLMSALQKGKISAVLMDAPSANFWLIHSSGQFKSLSKPFQVGQGLGIAVSDENKNLLPSLNHIITTMKENGTLKHLYETHFTHEF